MKVFVMKGKCYYCKQEFSKSGILKHLKSCKAVKEFTVYSSDDTKVTDNFILSISPKYNPSEYWLYVLIDKNTTLRELDQFLRDVWVECCDHLSSFKINGQEYESQVESTFGWGIPSKDMNVKIKDVMELNDKAEYMYDYGSTTYLEIKVVGELFSGRRQKNIEIMARNNVPVIKCSQCGEKAEYFDFENEEYLCGRCLEEQDGEGDLIVEFAGENSPRAGVCGYHGSSEDEINYLPEPSKTDSNIIDLKKGLGEKKELPSLNNSQMKTLENMLSSLKKMADDYGIKNEVKKWGYMDKNFSLDYHLNRLTKNELLDIARNLYIDKVSALKKGELAEKIIEVYRDRANYVLQNMDIERFEFLLDLAKQNGYMERSQRENIYFDYYRERGILFTGSVHGVEVVIMPMEFKKVVLSKNTGEFKKYLKENEEIIRLFWGMCYYYGVLELNTFRDLVKSYIDYDISNRNLKHLLYNGAYYYDEFDFNGYFGIDMVVEDFEYILEEQYKRKELDYYPFKKSNILKVTDKDYYLEDSKAVNRFRNFLVRNYNIEKDEVDDLIFALETDIKNDKSFNEIISDFLSAFDFGSIDEANTVAEEVMNFSNNTRHWTLKGYTPAEVGFKSGSLNKAEKIGRNDPCPCGSGKKYKKCCGKI